MTDNYRLTGAATGLPPWLALCILTLVAAGCGGFADDDGAPTVFVSVPPQAYLAERIAGDHARVRVLLPPGANHETYSPRPSEIRGLSRAALYVRTGLPFEEAAWSHIQETNPGMKIIDGREGVELRYMSAGEAHNHGHDHGHNHGAGAPDPHIWLAPENMMAQARQIRDALRELMPERAVEFETNANSLLAELEALDNELAETLAPCEGETFWVYHPAWGYFADAYGLKQQAVEQEGKEPGVHSVSQLVQQARADGVRRIFVEKQYSTARVEVIADEIGAEVIALDPLAQDYPDNLRHVAGLIREALTP